MKFKGSTLLKVGLICMIVSIVSVSLGQTKSSSRKKKVQPVTPVNELAKLRDDYVAATKEYKSSLEKLLVSYENNVKRAEEKLEVSHKLYDQGLIAKKQLDEYEQALTEARARIAETQAQMSAADSQIANVLLETKADEEFARRVKLARGALVSTTAFIRYNGGSAWSLSDAWKVQTFFSDSFRRPLPIAVFGQGAIHDRWRLDHRNAMDISLSPDSVEGHALMSFLQKNGIPFSAFREAIPGTATGPHIHIGRPSHRY